MLERLEGEPEVKTASELPASLLQGPEAALRPAAAAIS